eukprot:scaffold36543_cov121-Isochrysis_galbana.AAC.4
MEIVCRKRKKGIARAMRAMRNGKSGDGVRKVGPSGYRVVGHSRWQRLALHKRRPRLKRKA